MNPEERLVHSYRHMAFRALSKEEQAAHNKQGHFEYIPMNHADFQKMLYRAKEVLYHNWGDDQPLKFVDVGCGVGEKVVMAGEIFRDVTGIEVHPKYCRDARRLFKAALDGWRLAYGSTKPSINLIAKDAKKVNYKPFDCIYFYNPEADLAQEILLETKIAETAKVGAVILGNRTHTPESREKDPFSKNFLELGRHMWVRFR